MKPETFAPSMQELADRGVNYIAPPLWVLVTVAEGEIVPSAYAREARKAGLNLITWTLERSGPLGGGGGWYYQSIKEVTRSDGAMFELLHVLAQDVGVKGRLFRLAGDGYLLRELHGPALRLAAPWCPRRASRAAPKAASVCGAVPTGRPMTRSRICVQAALAAPPPTVRNPRDRRCAQARQARVGFPLNPRDALEKALQEHRVVFGTRRDQRLHVPGPRLETAPPGPEADSRKGLSALPGAAAASGVPVPLPESGVQWPAPPLLLAPPASQWPSRRWL